MAALNNYWSKLGILAIELLSMDVGKYKGGHCPPWILKINELNLLSLKKKNRKIYSFPTGLKILREQSPKKLWQEEKLLRKKKTASILHLNKSR